MTKQSLAVIMIAYVCVGAVRADDFQQQINELRNRIDAVQNDTAEMRESLGELKAKQNQTWLTQERSEEMRFLIQDVLNDADARVSLLGDGVLGGWSDGFFLASGDGRFKLNIGGLIQERYILNYLRVGSGSNSDRWRGGFENTRTRLSFSGHIFDKDTTFLVQAGFGWLDPNSLASNPFVQISSRLWDSWVKFRLSDSWSAKLGVFMLPFTRESLVSDKYQLAVDRSLIDYRVGLARSQGVEFTWSSGNKRVFLATTNGSNTLTSIIASNNNPTPPWPALDSDSEWSVTARTEFLLEGSWEQFNQFTSPVGSENATMFGIALHAQNQERNNLGGAKRDQVGITADLSMHFDGATLFASGTFHNQKNVTPTAPNVDWLGYVVQGSTYMTDTTEAFLRFEGGGAMLDDLGGDTVQILTAGANWYLDKQGLKVTCDYGWSIGKITPVMDNWMVGWRQSNNRDAQWLFRTQLQLAF